MSEQDDRTPEAAAPAAQGGEATVADHPESNRYEVRVEGRLAGFAEYTRGPGQIAFTHTEVDEAFGGRGLGGKLAQKALDDARATGNEVLPFCPFFAGFIKKHPDYADLIPADRRSEFDI